MKKFIFAVLFTSASLFSQIEFTMQDYQKQMEFGKKSQTLASDILGSSFMDLKVPSNTIAQNWITPNFTIEDTLDQVNLDIPNYEHKNSFPLATHGFRITFDFFGFPSTFDLIFRIANDSLYQLGVVTRFVTPESTFTDIKSEISDIKLFPIKIGYNSEATEVNEIDSVTYEVIRKIDTVDAFGSIKFSDGVTEPSLRLKVTEITEYYVSDSLQSSDTTATFIWMTKSGRQLYAKLLNFLPQSGNIQIVNFAETKIMNTSNISKKKDFIPNDFVLHQNFPNPFNNSTIINYQVNKGGFVSLKIYDLLGKEIKTLVNENLNAGNYSVNFSTENLSSGIYIYKLTLNGNSLFKKMNLLK